MMDCNYCGKPDTPVRQVPVPIPVSDCYCDECVDKCAEDYGGLVPGRTKKTDGADPAAMK